MKKAASVLWLTIICLSFLLGGCAGPGEPKGAHQVVGEGAANAGLIVYDMGAMTVNTIWGIGTFGYGFVEGQALLPLYDPSTGKFIAHKF